MFKVLDKLFVGKIYCVLVEGDILLLKNGLELTDEKGNVFEIETIGISHYQNIKDSRHYADLVLKGNVNNIGKTLFLKK